MKSSGYAEWPWNGSSRIWRTEVSDRVTIDGSPSERFSLGCGVPQGSCLGPLLFIIYASKLFRVVGDQLPHTLCYADDTQIYLSFKPNGNASQEDAVRVMERCIEKIRHCLIHGRLLLNDDKTAFIIIGTRQQLGKLQAMNIKVGGSEIEPSSQVENLTQTCICVTILQMYVKQVSSTCITLDALRSIYQEIACSHWCTHSSRAG